MKIFKIYFMITQLLAVFILTGCGAHIYTTNEIEQMKTKVVTKTAIQEVKVAVSCKIPTDICEFSGEGITPTLKLMECISIQKKLLELCSEDNSSSGYDPNAEAAK